MIGISVAPKLAPYLPETLGKPLRALPRLYSIWPFLVAIFLSLIIHSCNILAGHAIIHSLEPSVTLGESAVLMPLIGASAFFPFTVGVSMLLASAVSLALPKGLGKPPVRYEMQYPCSTN